MPTYAGSYRTVWVVRSIAAVEKRFRKATWAAGEVPSACVKKRSAMVRIARAVMRRVYCLMFSECWEGPESPDPPNGCLSGLFLRRVFFLDGSLRCGKAGYRDAE